MRDMADHRLQHQAPDAGYGAPAHDLTSSGMFPADVYTHPHYYDTGHEEYMRAWLIVHRVRGNPDAKVHIYRSVPAEHAHNGFQPGDWVSIVPGYARDHGKHNTDPAKDWPVIKTTVKASEVHCEGDLMEWGYNGATHEAAVVKFKGGHAEEVRQHADGIVRKVQRRK